MQGNEVLSPALIAEQNKPSCWIAVACADHVLRGVAGGFMQVCHGKAAPIQRIKAGDWVAYYSPSQQMGKSDGLCSFTAIGRVKLGVPYSFDMGNGFVPFRRDVRWLAAQTASIKPLLPQMAWTQDKPRWAAPLRFGLLQIGFEDMQSIAHAMQAKHWRDVS